MTERKVSMQFIDKIMNVEVLKMPVGKAFLLTAAFGMANGLSSTLDRMVGGRLPAIAVQAGVAAAIENLAPVKNFLGADLSELISVAALTSGINNQFNVSGTIVNLLDKVTAILPGATPMAIQAPVAATTAQSEMSGYQMGNSSSSMGQARTQIPNVDDVDLALLSARGYQTA